MVKRFVVFTIDEVRADISELDSHVVECCRDGARADVVRVLGCPADENCMAVGVGEQHGDESVGSPLLGKSAGPVSESNYAGECPDWLEHSDQCAFVGALGKLCYG